MSWNRKIKLETGVKRKAETTATVTVTTKDVKPALMPTPPQSPVDNKPSLSPMREEARRKVFLSQQRGMSSSTKKRPMKVKSRSASYPPFGPSSAGTEVKASSSFSYGLMVKGEVIVKPKLEFRRSSAETKGSVLSTAKPLPNWLNDKKARISKRTDEETSKLRQQKAKIRKKEENSPGFAGRSRNRHEHQRERQLDLHLYAAGISSPQRRQEIIDEWDD